MSPVGDHLTVLPWAMEILHDVLVWEAGLVTFELDAVELGVREGRRRWGWACLTGVDMCSAWSMTRGASCG